MMEWWSDGWALRLSILILIVIMIVIEKMAEELWL